MSHAAVVTSDLARARGTAERIVEALGAGADAIEVEPRLRELHFGAWEGHTWDEIQRRDAARLDGWMAAWTERGTPDGEGYRELCERVSEWAHTLDQRAGDIVVVAHAGSIRALLSRLLGISPQQAFRMRLDHAHVTALALRSHGAAQGAQLLYHNADRFQAMPE
jgi:broad specificity phosphatase PhoE